MIRGRARELEILDGALTRTLEGGHAEPLLLVGDAGMGKSALLDETARRARSRGMRLARAAAPQGGEANAFALVEDIVRCLPEDLARLPDEDAEMLHEAPRDATVGPGPVAAALLHLLVEAGQHQPLLVLVDDLHWADTGSLVALGLAVGRLGRERVSYVASARPRPALDQRLAAWTTVEVGPLGLDAAVSVLRTGLPDPAALTNRHAGRLAESLGRCPLALVEAGRLLTAGQIAGRDPLPDPLPLSERLGAAWGRSWSDLPEPTRTALLALAVTQGAGGALTARVLSDLGLGSDALDPTAADRLLDLRAPCPGGSARLAHPLIRDAIIAAAGLGAVRAMHAHAAEAAQALGLAPSLVIAHVAAAATPGDTRAMARLVAEAERAEAAELGDPAAYALLAAAELALTDVERSRLAARAARTLMEYSLSSIQTARILALADLRVLSAEERFWVEWLRSEWLDEEDLRRCEQSLEGTIERAQQIDTPMLPWIVFSAMTGAWGLLDGEAGLRHGSTLRALAERADADDDGRMPAWACRGMYALALFQVGQVRASRAELEAVGQASCNWRPSTGTRLVQQLQVAVVDKEMSQMHAGVDVRLENLAERQAGDPGPTLGFVRRTQAERALRRGQLILARALIDEAWALDQGSTSRVGLIDWLGVSARIAAAQGDAAMLTRQAAELREVAARIGWLQVVSVADRAQGLLALGEGRLDDALTHLEPLAEAPLLGRGPWEAVPLGRADLVEALSRSGEADRAATVASALTDTLGPSADPLARGLVTRSQGLVTRGDPAHRALATAIALFDQAGDPFEAARTHLLLGEVLRRERRIQDARHELRLALAEFERMGASTWAARAQGELRASGAVVPAPVPDPLATLTPQERRVAEAVASGATDRQIAAAMFLSHRTVAFHLSSVYRKLGVTGRAALAGRLAQDPPGPRSRGQAGPG